MKSIFKLAIPSVITNITIPLLSLVDVAIVGRMGSDSYISAVSIAGAIINVLYWAFGFLRMSTTGLTAQAYGANERHRCGEVLLRAVSIASAGGLLLIPLGYLFIDSVIRILFPDSDAEVTGYVKTYFMICICGAPAALIIYVIKGWLVGMQNTFATMIIAVSVNVINIVLSLFFVFGRGMKVEGVALGTVLSQYIGILIGCIILKTKYIEEVRKARKDEVFKDLDLFFKVNLLIMVRNFCIISVTHGFVFLGIKYGETTVSANTMLMQLFTFFSYFMDGFAYAGEALAGRYTGSKDNEALYGTIRKLFALGAGLALLFTAIYYVFTPNILRLLTNQESVLSSASPYVKYVVFIPCLSFAAFLWDGIMVGRTQIRAMVITLVFAAVVFFGVYYVGSGQLGNDALWLAFLLYLASRSIMQTLLRKLM